MPISYHAHIHMPIDTSEESTVLREELGQPGMGPPASPELQQQPLELVTW